MSKQRSTCTVFSHTPEEMKERLIKEGWDTWYDKDYWVHPSIVSDPKIQNYTDYGMRLEDAFMYNLDNKIKPKLTIRAVQAFKNILEILK